MPVTFKDICQAHDRIQPFVHRTPILTSRIINDLVGAELYFKCENFQKGGAFKARGAFNALYSMSQDELKNGIVTHSSGNHAAAVALACQSRDTHAYVVMPSNAPDPKKQAVERYGATIVECEPTLVARGREVNKILEKTGAKFLHPYDDDRVISGQGTTAKEFIEDGPALDIVLCPVGGGGLMAGCAISVKHMLENARMIACEPLNADDAKRSFERGEIIPQTNPNTIADGLLTSLGERNFAIMQKKVDAVWTVKEENIILAMRLIWQYMKIMIEPSSAVPLGSILENQPNLNGQKVGIILTGGNQDFDKLPW